MNNNTLSFKELMLSIHAMRKQTRTLLGKNKAYEGLLKLLLTKDFYNDDEHYFSSKDLSQLTGLNHQKIKKQMEQIHNDIFEITRENPNLFSYEDLEVEFYVKSYYNSITFKGRLKVIPRIGDQLDFPFLRAINGGSGSYYLENVHHNFTDTTHTIALWIKPGYYNSYEKFYNDKENFERWQKRY